MRSHPGRGYLRIPVIPAKAGIHSTRIGRWSAMAGTFVPLAFSRTWYQHFSAPGLAPPRGLDPVGEGRLRPPENDRESVGPGCARLHPGRCDRPNHLGVGDPPSLRSHLLGHGRVRRAGTAARHGRRPAEVRRFLSARDAHVAGRPDDALRYGTGWTVGRGRAVVCALRRDPALRVAAGAPVTHPGRSRPDGAVLRVVAAVHHLRGVLHLRDTVACVPARFPLGRLPGRPALRLAGRLARPDGGPARGRSGRQPSATHPQPRGACGAFVVSSPPPGPGPRRHRRR